MRQLFIAKLFLWLLCLPIMATANNPATLAEQAEQAELREFLKKTITSADSFDDRFDAEVWLVDMSGRLARFVKKPKQRLKMLRAIHREATKAELKPDLVLALIEVESHFNEYAISRVGAQGLMQVMPFWKNEIGRPEDNLTDIDTNLSYGCRILQFYLKKEKGNWMNALARYNGSYGKYWYPERVMNAWRKRWFVNET
ncbi:lytic transglycosylase domain-containing protein [Dasania sp. GY-MA-18]|uniref:Lytic transglycosylase domain-containing protein n=1 Tax=Dasania phycosphaerae TaxID=2950436 RepID=A0A9J6RGW7_9GAMM|nr:MULTISPECIES: lytic transglycosylase domain-containing protein [Dasania]MCR8921158.1 lytic transglycosylase domain-containing protein [Dasania sp. GY-MA-18]MCZ0863586.1 lytic transglycosylase domain-containing protein [Dasania phycosphaerae]MCZ0867314.1 lytic transglycosylase domain-containing protein [Dasania phycosphaerae]